VLLMNGRPEVTLSEGTVFLLLLLLLLLWVRLLLMFRRRLLNLLRTLLHLLNLLRRLQHGGSFAQDICIVNNLAFAILVTPHVVAHDVVVSKHTEADGALGVLLFKL
jgi:hypothetical protein